MNQELTAQYLPSDWWQKYTTCRTLVVLFEKHMLGFYLEVQIEGEKKDHLYSGFLLEYQESLVWLTSGHSVDNIQQVLEYPQTDILTMQWVDGGTIPGAEAVPVHHRPLRMYSAPKESNIDFGAIGIMGFDKAHVGRNKHPLTEDIWRGLDLARPEGYFLIGFPEESAHEAPNGLYHIDLVCLPVRRIEISDSRLESRSWNDPDEFYGEILPFTDASDLQFQPKSIAGMSGGPIFSIERMNWELGEKILYRLVGIQQGWFESDRLIHAVPIQKIVNLIKLS